MHEFALADAVVKTALQVAREEGLERLTRIVVGVGELQQISDDLFAYSLTEVLPARDPELAGVDFEVVQEAARFRCRACGTEFGRPDPASEDEAEAMHLLPEMVHAFVRCPGCGSPDFEVVAGRGVVLRSVEGEARDEGGG